MWCALIQASKQQATEKVVITKGWPVVIESKYEWMKNIYKLSSFVSIEIHNNNGFAERKKKRYECAVWPALWLRLRAYTLLLFIAAFRLTLIDDWHQSNTNLRIYTKRKDVSEVKYVIVYLELETVQIDDSRVCGIQLRLSGCLVVFCDMHISASVNFWSTTHQFIMIW